MFLGRTIALLCSSCYLICFPQHLSLILAWQFFRLVHLKFTLTE
ncbi:hypothetical protein AC96_1596 [Escherichia coli 2-156-04_S4_C2]|nr:hypothetical protein AC96_1596 [Escherichia coli 2-156-04_S4_C2]